MSDKLGSLLEQITFPDTPEERDEAERELRVMLANAKADALEEAGNAPLPAPKNGQTSGFRAWLRSRAQDIRQAQI